jgi:hypothetical protein
MTSAHIEALIDVLKREYIIEYEISTAICQTDSKTATETESYRNKEILPGNMDV